MSEILVPLEAEPPGSSQELITRRHTLFYNRFFPSSNLNDWTNWKWQIKNRITTVEQLKRIVKLTEEEKEILSLHKENLPLAITPYYAAIMDLNDVNDPIRKCVVPRIDEMKESQEESIDPLGEEHQSPVKCIVHRYPDRVLFLATKFCSTNCRFCTRSRIIEENSNSSCIEKEWLEGINYIQNHQEVRDVLISGGDPLTMTDDRIEFLLSRIRAIKHVEIIRIGTKVPAVLPQRINKSLVNMLKKYHPLLISVHFTHPVELTKEAEKACIQLADAGVPLGSQTVLLKGINDNSEILRKLFTGLLKIRVKPYYTYICDKISGSKHFRTDVETGINIFRELQGKISGYAIPKLIVDAPNGMGKIPVMYNYIKEKNGDKLILENYESKVFEYPNS